MKFLSGIHALYRRPVVTPLALSLTLALPFLAGCDDDSSDASASAPEVQAVYTRYRTNDIAYAEFGGNSFTSTLQYYVHAEDSGGPESIELIRVLAPDMDSWTTIHDTRPETEEDNVRDNYVAAHGYFSSSNYFRSDEGLEHHRPIEGYKVEVTNSDGLVTTESFSLTIPDGLGTGQETFFYDHEFDGETADGLQGLTGASADILNRSNDALEVSISSEEDKASAIILTFNRIDGSDNTYIGATRAFERGTDYEADNGANHFQLDVNESDDFTYYSSAGEWLLEDATHYKLVHYGPDGIVEFDEGSINLMPFLYWSGYIEIQ